MIKQGKAGRTLHFSQRRAKNKVIHSKMRPASDSFNNEYSHFQWRWKVVMFRYGYDCFGALWTSWSRLLFLSGWRSDLTHKSLNINLCLHHLSDEVSYLSFSSQLRCHFVQEVLPISQTGSCVFPKHFLNVPYFLGNSTYWCTVEPPYLWGICFKTPSRCLNLLFQHYLLSLHKPI